MTAAEWKNRYDQTTGKRAAPDDIRVAIDILSALEQGIAGSGGTGLAMNRPRRKELLIVVDTNTATIADALVDREVMDIIGEKTDGTILKTSDLSAVVASIDGSAFIDRYLLTYAINPTLSQVIDSTGTPLIQSSDLVINLSAGHGLKYIHILYLDNTTAINMNTDNIIANLNAGDTNIIHKCGKPARVAQVLLNGEEIGITWRRDPANPNAAIIITSTDAVAGVEVNIIAY